MADEDQNIQDQLAQDVDRKAAVTETTKKLTFEDWEEKAEGTDALRGRLVLKGSDGYEVKVAPKPAFKLKPGKGGKANISYSKNAEIKETEFNTHLEQKLLEASFTERTIKAAISSTAPGFMLGLSGDASWREELSSSSSNAANVTSIHSSFSFPRATIVLGDSDLVPSDESLDFLTETLANKDAEGNIEAALKKFEQEFGAFFAREVTLGGRRYEVKKVRGHNESKVAEQKVTKKVNAGIEASPMVAGGKLGVGQEKGQNSKVENDASAQQSGRSLRVIGGNELRYENVTEWADTIGPLSNWKAIEHNEVVPLLQHLKWVLARDSMLAQFSMLVGQMLKHSEELQWEALRSMVFSLRLTLKSTIKTKKRFFFLNRKFRILTIEPIDPNPLIEWISVTIPGAHLKEKVYRPQIKKVPGRDLFEEEAKRSPINVKVKGLESYQVFLALHLASSGQQYRWLNPPPAKDAGSAPDILSYPLNYTLPSEDDETSYDIEYRYM